MTQSSTIASPNKEIAIFIGELFSFNNSLKLFHWQITGEGSYAKHIALDEAITSLSSVIDRITETTIALMGELPILIPETRIPNNITKHVSDFYHYIEMHRDLFPENFSLSIIDDYQETLQQLSYKLVRLQ